KSESDPPAAEPAPPSREPAEAPEVTGTAHPDVAPTPADAEPDLVDMPPPLPPDTRDLRTFMNEEVAPRFARPQMRDALIEVLETIPKRVEPPFAEAFQQIVDGIPEEGSLASTCKTCHVQHRLAF